MFDLFAMLGSAFAAVTLLTVVLWAVYYFQENASVLDVGWGIGFILVVWSYFFFGSGDTWKTLAMALMVTAWGGRLTRHLWLRYLNSSREDPRYALLRENWPAGAQSMVFLMLFVFQGMLIMCLSLPFLLVAYASNDVWTHWEVWGMVVWLVGLAGETTADAQLARFRQDPANQGAVCRAGLWRFSRHPNYFFEIVVWTGFFLFAYPSPGGALAVFSLVVMAVLLLKVSGIPVTEAQSVRTKGEAYKDYQRTTSMLVPWPPTDRAKHDGAGG